MKQKDYRLNNAALRICLDKVEDATVAGRIFGYQLPGPATFADLGGLILRIDEILDRRGFPQAYQRTRVFTSKAQPSACDEGDGMSQEQMQAARGEMFTFEVLVLTRQSSTWQGNVDWLDGEKPQQFGSALELVRIIDEKISRLK